MTLRPFNKTLQDRLSALRYRLRPHEPDPLKTGPVSGQLTQATARGSPNPTFDTLLHDPRVQFADVDGDGLADILDTSLEQGKPAYTVAYNIGDGRFQARPLRAQPGWPAPGSKRRGLPNVPVRWRR